MTEFEFPVPNGSVPDEVTLRLLEDYIRNVESGIDDGDHFVPIAHQELHWLTCYARRLRGEPPGGETACGHPIYKHPVGSPGGPTIEEFAAGIQRALDEAVHRHNEREREA